MDTIRVKKIYLIFTGILALCVILFIYGVLSGTRTTPEQDRPIPPSPTPYPGTENVEQTAGYRSSTEQITAQEKETIERSEKVGDLLLKLPYFGEYFAMRYDYATNQYIVVINSRFPSEGNAEFDAFLQENGIQSRTWVRRLVVR